MKRMAVGVLALVCCAVLVDCTADQDGGACRGLHPFERQARWPAGF